jgi:glucokinase
MLLAGDLGGTKTDLAVFAPESGPRKPLAQARYPSSAYPSLEAIVQTFLAEHAFPITEACFDVAGPVTQGRAQITNLPWIIQERSLKDALRLEAVTLLNDLQAIACAVPLLEADDVHTVHTGTPHPGGTIAVIAPGTGLGEAFLTWDGTRYVAHASEGGHADFAPSNDHQDELLCFLRRRLGHVSVERVCSGLGIPNLYEFLSESAYAVETPDVAARLAVASDPTRFIVETALDAAAPSALCKATMELFVAILGAEAGNLALKVLATGGVYLAGGIPAHILPLLHETPFLEALHGKGRFVDLLAQVPVQVITNPRVALLGAASYALERAPSAVRR